MLIASVSSASGSVKLLLRQEGGPDVRGIEQAGWFGYARLTWFLGMKKSFSV